MKKTGLLLIVVRLLGVFALTACGGSSGDSKADESGSEVAGEAAEAAEEAVEDADDDDNDADDAEPYDGPLLGTWVYEGNIINAKYVFNADGTGTYQFGKSEDSLVHDLTYKVEGEKLLIKYKEESSVYEVEYVIDGNELTIEDPTEGETVYKREK